MMTPIVSGRPQTGHTRWTLITWLVVTFWVFAFPTELMRRASWTCLFHVLKYRNSHNTRRMYNGKLNRVSFSGWPEDEPCRNKVHSDGCITFRLYLPPFLVFLSLCLPLSPSLSLPSYILICVIFSSYLLHPTNFRNFSLYSFLLCSKLFGLHHSVFSLFVFFFTFFLISRPSIPLDVFLLLE